MVLEYHNPLLEDVEDEDYSEFICELAVLLEASGGKKTTALNKGLYPIIKAKMEKNNNAFKKVVANYIDKRHNQLFDTGPNDRIFFGADDQNEFYKAVGITEADILPHLQKTYYWEISAFNPRAAKDPFTVAMINVIKFFYDKHEQKNMELAAIYLAFSAKFYPSIHSGSFPKVVPAQYRSIMDYVVNNTLTQKFDLKKEGSVFGAVRSICITWIQSYGNRFKSFSDEDIVYLIQQLHNRIKSFMKNVAKEYYKAFENREYLNFESDNVSQDGYRIADNDSTIAAQATERTMTFITSNTISMEFCTMCSDQNIRAEELKSIMEAIVGDNTNLSEMRELVNILITDYLENSKEKDITSLSFLSYTIKAKPNIKNKDVIRAKNIVLGWLDENSEAFRRKKSREATKNSYYKAVLEYVALCINAANK